ncbi:hypothetical protein LINPERHAP2_LOCUS32945 [Linum perenne]
MMCARSWVKEEISKEANTKNAYFECVFSTLAVEDEAGAEIDGNACVYGRSLLSPRELLFCFDAAVGVLKSCTWRATDVVVAIVESATVATVGADVVVATGAWWGVSTGACWSVSTAAL